MTDDTLPKTTEKTPGSTERPAGTTEPSVVTTEPAADTAVDVTPPVQVAPVLSLFEKFGRDFQPMKTRKFFEVIDVMLKRPGQLAHTLVQGPEWKIVFYLLLILLISLTGIGGMMGSFSGDYQLWAVPLKVVLGTIGSALICLPSLYILICLSGGEQSFSQVWRVLLMALVLTGILFLGFIPVAWIFSQATESEIFMGILYLVIWGTGLFFGLRLMKTTFLFLNKKPMGALGLWVIVFVLVLLQMSTTLRPLIGTYEPLQFGEKKFFISHWIELAQQ